MRQYSHLLRFQGAGQMFITDKEGISAGILEQSKGLGTEGCRTGPSEPVLEFLNNLWGASTDKESGCRTGPPGYIG